MQYVDKDGNIKNIPLATVQPIVSPDSDNALYESANGLKVSVSPDSDNLLHESANGLKVVGAEPDKQRYITRGNTLFKTVPANSSITVNLTELTDLARASLICITSSQAAIWGWTGIALGTALQCRIQQLSCGSNISVSVSSTSMVIKNTNTTYSANLELVAVPLSVS